MTTEARDALVCVYPGCPVANIPQHLYHTPTTGNVRFGSEWNRVHHPFLTASTLWTLARSDFAARVEALEGALRFLSTYEKDPPEVLKDDYAYDRLLAFIHEVAALALLSEPTPAPVERCAVCGELWPCWQVRVDPIESHHHPFTPEAPR